MIYSVEHGPACNPTKPARGPQRRSGRRQGAQANGYPQHRRPPDFQALGRGKAGLRIRRCPAMAVEKPAVFLFTEHGVLALGEALCNAVFHRAAVLRFAWGKKRENATLKKE